MDLYFEPDHKAGIPPFWIEVDYFDTIKQIKEKIAIFHGVPVHQQTLKFNGKTLPDDLNIITSDIPDQSSIKLIINTTPTADHQPPPPPLPLTHEPIPPPPPLSFSHKIKILLKTIGIVMEMDMNDSVSKLKEKINELQLGMIPLSRIVVSSNGIELHDHYTLRECQLFDGSEVEIMLKPITPPTISLKPLMPPPPTMTTAATTTTTRRVNLTGNHYSKKVKVNVVSRCGEYTLTLDMNPVTKVSELRKELEKAKDQGIVFPLPEEGYFFIHDQAVMSEDQSFRWHGVEQDDIIDVFNGHVTSG